jgi:hypothetical protein
MTKHLPSLRYGTAGECRMTKEARMLKPENSIDTTTQFFVIRASSFIRHWSFELRHSSHVRSGR